jgi:hypothetical protein
VAPATAARMTATTPVFPALKEAAPLPLPLKLPVDPEEAGADEEPVEEEPVEAPEAPEAEPALLPVVEAPLEEPVVLAPLALEPTEKVVLTEAEAVVGAWAMENWLDVAKTWLMFEMFTALKVYCESAGTMGHSMLRGLAFVGSTLLARAREFPKEGWFNSRENEGSESVAVQETEETKPAVTFVGVSKAMAASTAGRAAARRQSLANIFEVRYGGNYGGKLKREVGDEVVRARTRKKISSGPEYFYTSNMCIQSRGDET